MRALVTGGTGCVGANLVAALTARGITARVLRRESASLAALAGLTYETVVGDLFAGQEALAAAMAGCDWVFHVAAATQYWRLKRTDWLYRVNVAGTRNMLAAALRAGIKRFIFTSSVGALGLSEPGKLLDETSQFNLKARQFPYGHSKHLAEIEVRRAIDAGLAAVIVNPTIIIGPRDVNKLGGSLIFEALKGRLRFSPPGGANFVAVEDVVAGHLAAAERGEVGERYILAGQNLYYHAAASIVCTVVGRPPPSIVIPERMLPFIAAGTTAARAILGNRVPVNATQVRLSTETIFVDGRKAIQQLSLPQTPFKTAIEQAYHWYKQNSYLL